MNAKPSSNRFSTIYNACKSALKVFVNTCKCALKVFAKVVLAIKGFVPVTVGVFVFVFLIFEAKGGSPDITKSALMHATAFLGINIVYCVFVASIIVAIIGTFLYLADLDELSDVLHGLPGREYVVWAKRITFAVAVASACIIVCSLMFQKSDASEGCSYSELTSEFIGHISFVGGLFFAFLIIDGFTIKGTKEAILSLQQRPAINVAPSTEHSVDKILLNRQFAQEQVISDLLT